MSIKLKCLKQKKDSSRYSNNTDKENLANLYNQQQRPHQSSEIASKINVLNEKYKMLASKIETKAITRNQSVGKVKNELADKSTLLNELEGQIYQVQDQIKKNETMLKQKRSEQCSYETVANQEHKRDPSSRYEKQNDTYDKREYSKYGGEYMEQLEDFENEKRRFYQAVMDTEAKIKIEEEQLMQTKRNLGKFQIECEERRVKLEKNEKEIEKKTRKIEHQNEEIANEYNKKRDGLNKAIEKFQSEKEEFMQFEKEFQRKNFELKMEKERIVEFSDQLKNEKNEMEKQYSELGPKFQELLDLKARLEKCSFEMNEKESIINKKIEEFNKDSSNLKKEKEDFIQTITQAEIRLNQREQLLNEKEKDLNDRKEVYDDFDLKLLGMQMNEELWQKKRNYEIGNLMDEVKKLKDKEKELHKREEKIARQEEEIKRIKADSTMSTSKPKIEKQLYSIHNSIGGISSIHGEFNQNLKDKTLCPLSTRSNYHHNDSATS